MTRLRGLDLAALILVIIGGINWGLVGLFGFNLVAAIFGELSIISRIVYVLVAASAVYVAIRSPHLAHYDERGHTPAQTPTA
jgi:hypothetical protein